MKRILRNLGAKACYLAMTGMYTVRTFCSDIFEVGETAMNTTVGKLRTFGEKALPFTLAVSLVLLIITRDDKKRKTEAIICGTAILACVLLARLDVVISTVNTIFGTSFGVSYTG